ncbi:shikimate dehydrogenase family protein [Acuticoccus kandeliae]|uniref:shikimate dehydrogenase family protein n=1 Tax=Acuticoccus kandeliae TaxID=2073160 RepID=UPI000D3E9EE2|nr:serine carboxypeptidase [Acuticoccus kandeliae]
MSGTPDPNAGLPLPLTGTTRVYAIIGDPIAQVGSPRVFNALFREKGIAAVLIPLHVKPAGLSAFLSAARGLENVDGIIVTIPHKMDVVPLIDVVGDAGRRIGAVNAIRRLPDGTLHGDNFDGAGCVIGLEREGHAIAGRSAMILGAGGAGAAIAHAFADAGVGPITLHDVSAPRAAALAETLRPVHLDTRIADTPPDPAAFDIVVNATPIGSAPGDPYPLPPDRLRPGTLVVDVLLKPAVSPLLEAAAARGCATQPGYRMLEGQAEAIARYFGVIE